MGERKESGGVGLNPLLGLPVAPRVGGSGSACGSSLSPASVAEAKVLSLRLEDMAAVREAIEGRAQHVKRQLGHCLPVLTIVQFFRND
jgi:hypothetical protein